MTPLQFDDAHRERYGPVLCGIDESGRGAFAGPIAAGAVILPGGLEIPGVLDSKKLTAVRRRALAEIIKDKALGWGVAFVSPQEIDAKGLTWANAESMRLAAMMALESLGGRADIYVIDQSPDTGLFPVKMLPKAESASLSVAAASILAKTIRDAHMEDLGLLEQHNYYGLADHHGYVNPKHVEAVNQYGRLYGLHRFSYVVKGCPETQIF